MRLLLIVSEAQGGHVGADTMRPGPPVSDEAMSICQCKAPPFARGILPNVAGHIRPRGHQRRVAVDGTDQTEAGPEQHPDLGVRLTPRPSAQQTYPGLEE